MYKIQEVAPKVRVKVPQYITYSDFGIREYDARHHRHHHHAISEGLATKKQRGRFICTGVPGTGFFERITESDTYEQMVNKYSRLKQPSFFKHLFGKEFSFDDEMAKVNTAMRSAEDPIKRMILESYGNCINVASQAEEHERVVIALKRRMHHGQNKLLSSTTNHYRNIITQLESEMNVCQLKPTDFAQDELLESYKEFCNVFEEVMGHRRLWVLDKKDKLMSMKRVFLDFGVFDYMCTAEGTPMMRDAEDAGYYFYPTFMIKARSTVDFDVYDLKDLKVVYREATGEAFSLNRASSAEVYGRSLGEVYLPQLEQSFYFAHRSVAGKLVHAIHEYQRKLM